jgi:hypothetical protein
MPASAEEAPCSAQELERLEHMPASAEEAPCSAQELERLELHIHDAIQELSNLERHTDDFTSFCDEHPTDSDALDEWLAEVAQS